jgi:Type I phosphodiesterase / nucleotide pyrophosphatase
MSAHPRLIVVQLNEVNFDVVERYLRQHRLPALERLVRGFKRIETYAEPEYANLEPWIQWVSAQTGKTYGEHGVFRLGDIVKTDLPQVFEALEARGLRVGALSPMNASNRLRAPAYFVPDPWTDTASDGSGFSRRLTEMLRQTVNDNATQRVSWRSKFTILEALLRSFDPVRTTRLLAAIVASRRKPWTKSLILDQLIHLLHRSLCARGRPDVSFVFLNAGAHIQHHYFFNSAHAGSSLRNPAWYIDGNADPVLDMLIAYDRILADYIQQAAEGVRLIVATGLTQVPYDRVKYYYRLSDHASFLERAGITGATVLPRMTRDFELTFADAAAAKQASELLRAMRLARDDKPVFGEVDERGASLFVTLTYADEIRPDDALVSGDRRIADFGRMVAFVAIKNGMHSSKGFVFVSPDTPAVLPAGPVHVSALYDLTLQAAA